MRPIPALLLAAAICAALFCLSCGERPVRLAIQPFGKIDREAVDRAKAGLAGVYRARITVLPAVDLPASAWYPATARYRADRLLDFLGGDRYDDYDRVLGLTDRDISTTKGGIQDWGIFGLGSLGGKACVVSTFRLGRGASRDLFNQRFIKVVIHEVGHTFGLPHCPVNRCLMEDAKGTIVTVDRETGKFCDSCRKRLAGMGALAP